MGQIFITPFVEDEALRRALMATLVLALSAGPVGVFLMLRRMSLAGDALSHAVLPGVAAAFLLSGLAVIPMTIGGLVAGLCVALFSGLVTRVAKQREDISFALSIVGMALVWRPLVAECLDPGFLRSVSGAGRWAHLTFLMLVVFNLVGAFQAMGSLLAVGLMMLPAATAKFWVKRLEAMTALSIGIGMIAGYLGLVIAHQFALDPAPAIILVAGIVYLGSILFGRRGILFERWQPARHRTA
jgi:zinc/manganese transport system permease protein